MKHRAYSPITAFLVFLALNASAATFYVNLNNSNPAPPYTNWITAATNIQDAVDAAAPGDDILVGDGVYQFGGRVARGALTNRVTITKPVTLHSVNGPTMTTIEGYQIPGTVYGPGAIRCVYLTNGAAIAGFTVSGGATRSIPEEAPYEDTIGAGIWCESVSETVSNCVILANRAGDSGGGVYQGTVYDSTIQENRAVYGGGGAYSSVLTRCRLLSNSASAYGHGKGGGAYGGVLNNCLLLDNSSDSGGGACNSFLRNCVLTGNAASGNGGGADACTLVNCTATLNSAQNGGGINGGAATNSVVYYNFARNGPNHSGASFSYSCSIPLPAEGPGNFADAPVLADAWHLAAASPCRRAGSTAFAEGTDADGESWLNPPSVGADEFYPESVTGLLALGITANYTNVTTNFTVKLTGAFSGHAGACRWDLGDGTAVSNQPVVFHSWASPGNYPVSLTAFNDTFPAGVTTTLMVYVDDSPRCVAQDSVTPVWPYRSWATAATNIQEAVDAAPVGGLVLVSNGVYETGGRAVDFIMTNRVAITNPLVLQSLNGPAVTHIKGYQIPSAINGAGAIRCVYLAEGSSLIGFTLTNGATLSSSFDGRLVYGGGVYCASAGVLVSNCVLTGNSCIDRGGGATCGTLVNCTLIGNAAYEGGGANESTLSGCTLSGNRALWGGAAIYCTLNDCVISSNSISGLYHRGAGVRSCNLTNCLLLANTSSDYGGGASASTLASCTVLNNSAPYAGGGADGCTLLNCTLAGNSASAWGGGAYASTLYSCILSNNSAGRNGGGGASSSTLNDCLLIANSSALHGGGALYGSLNRCTLAGNYADWYGGAVANATVQNCLLSNNVARFNGGGAYSCNLANCVILSNSLSFAGGYGGGAMNSSLVNCTLVGNAAQTGGGAKSSSLTNCIVYYNSAAFGPNWSEGTLGYSCTTPLPPGTGNFTNSPLFFDRTNGNYRL